MKKVIQLNEKNKTLLSDAQKAAIDRGLEDVTNGKLHSHQDVMKETKKHFPHLFNRKD
ncbi:hypothetical protein [Flavobacterium sp. MDT1-60]|uniref:hypothetical protein n=1 Tax=Flavobacterium sp. MDT1-60 TaxID=1979344 RepID=UPI00177DE04C|nr:hypothetical protein [Flavobacterium sp. MDT1-60]QOG03036.1 hypothetical protein IHE43_01985 [Flavobacterium sp. MDT1-60]